MQMDRRGNPWGRRPSPRRRDDDRALVVVPALGARRDRSGERPIPRKEGTVLVGLGGYQMFDSLAIDRDGPLQLTGELLTLRSEPRAAPYGAAPRPETSADQLCQRNCCGLRADSWEIITLTSAGPPNAIAASSALFRSFGFSTNQPLPPKASIILS